MKINQAMEKLGFVMMNTPVRNTKVCIWTMEKTEFDELITRLNSIHNLEYIEFEDDI